MDKIDRDNSLSCDVTFIECNVRCLLFVDDLALLNLNKSHLQYALDQYSDECLDAGIKINTVKTEITCLSKHNVQCFFQTNGVTCDEIPKIDYWLY